MENRLFSQGESPFVGANHVLPDLGVRKTFADGFFDAFFLLGAGTSAIDAALNGVQQLKPIFQGRIFERLPLVITFFAGEETPFTADALDIDLKADAFFGDTLPTDFGFSGHEAKMVKSLNRSFQID